MRFSVLCKSFHAHSMYFCYASFNKDSVKVISEFLSWKQAGIHVSPVKHLAHLGFVAKFFTPTQPSIS